MRSEHQKRIDEFMRKAGQEVPKTPSIPSDEVRRLRANLILEESLETVEALGFEAEVTYNQRKRTVTLHARRTPDLVEIADGCADISVVTIGTLSACGISDQELIEEVDRSNLAKFELPQCPDHPGGILHHLGSGCYACTVVEKGAQCSVRAVGPYRSPEGKWVKAPYWKPPRIKEILERQATGYNEVVFQVETGKQTVDASRWVPLTDLVSKEAEVIATAREYAGLVRLLQAKDELVAMRRFETAELLNSIICEEAKAIIGARREQFPPTSPQLETVNEFIGRQTSGGRTALSGCCKAPLSDELARKLTAPEFRKHIFKCPECQKPLNGMEVTYA